MSDLDDDKCIAEYLEIAKQKFEEGNKTVLLMAMHQCLLMKKPLPEWLRLAFIEAYQSASAFEIRSWDQAFGPPQDKGAHLEVRKQHAELRLPIILHVEELKASGVGVDEGLFEKIAEELDIEGVSGSTVRTIYYDDRSQELHCVSACKFDPLAGGIGVQN